jgi:P-type conjugative transfer protein TrbJ
VKKPSAGARAFYPSRATLLAGAATLACLIGEPTRANAFIVTCANCSEAVTQLQSMATQIEQKLTEVAMLQNNLRMYANMVTNTAALPQSVWANVQGDIMQVRSLTNAASLLTGSSGSILQRLQSAQGYANQAANLPQNIGAQFQMYRIASADASNSLGRTLGVQQGQEQNNAALQVAIQVHSQTASGQMQAIQAGNELAALTNTQLQEIHTTLVAAAQEQATQDLISADRQAIADAYTTQFFSQADAPLTGYPRY